VELREALVGRSMKRPNTLESDPSEKYVMSRKLASAGVAQDEIRRTAHDLCAFQLENESCASEYPREENDLLDFRCPIRFPGEREKSTEADLSRGISVLNTRWMKSPFLKMEKHADMT